MNTYKYVQTAKKEFVLSKQMLRNENSIGANVKEAIGGETKYNLKVLKATQYIKVKQADSIMRDEESYKILSPIQIPPVQFLIPNP